MNTPQKESFVDRYRNAAMEKFQKIQFGPFSEKKDELVLCFPTKNVLASIERHGDEIGSAFAIAAELNTVAEIRPRGLLEANPDYVHAIAYIAFRKGDQVYVYSRGKTGGEDKLHDRASIGFGGHANLRDMRYINIIETFEAPEGISDDDYKILADSKSRKDCVDVGQTMVDAFAREYREEVDLLSYSGNKQTDIFAQSINTKLLYVNSDVDNGVHKVHLGFISIVDIPPQLDDSILIPKENEGLGWFPISQETIDRFPAMELWSKMLMQALIDDTTFAMTVDEAEEQRLVIFNQQQQLLDQQLAMSRQYAEQLGASVEGLDQLVDVETIEDAALEAAESVEDEHADVTEEELAEAEVQASDAEEATLFPEDEEAFAVAGTDEDSPTEK